MADYYVNRNAQPTGEHEVHASGCPTFPDSQNAKYLGYFSHCRDAVTKAKEFYDNVDGCKNCSIECHNK